MVLYNVILAMHNGKEPQDFRLNRQSGTDDFLFLHFKTPAIFGLYDKEYKLSQGTCILLSPGTPHSIRPDGCDLIHDWLHFMPRDESVFKQLKIDTNVFLYPDSPDFITASVKKCELELINKEEFSEEMMSSEVLGMFIRLKRQLNGGANGYHAEAFKMLRSDIYREPDKYNDTTEMANAVGLSRSRFSVAYKEVFGISPQKDHIRAKISKASYLLSIGTLSLQEISEMCGYSNIYHFIRQFRSATGITPGKYRKNF